MPEDRFGDLGPAGAEPGEPVEARRGSRETSAADRLAAQDERESRASTPDTVRRSRPYVMAAGLMLMIGVALAVLAPNLVGGPATGTSALRGLPPGSTVPDAAVPLATGTLDGDANVARPGGPPADGRPACDVRGPGVVNFCDLRRRPLVVSFIVLRGTDCEPALDVFDRVSREVPEVSFVAVVSGESRSDVAALVRRRRLSVPVGVDRDGALVNLFRVGVCPTTTFSGTGGRVLESRIGSLSAAQLRDSARRLAERSR
ncbi:MAG: TlpA family protein disulfide reductase [Thermoleophilaceae bacterium]